MSDDRRIRIFDTTLRDGEQSPGCSMNLAETLTLARQLERLGVDVIEAGFPIASEGDFEAVRVVALELREATVAGLARTSPADIERCGRALEGCRAPRIHTFIATSDIHLKHKLIGSAAACGLAATCRARPPPAPATPAPETLLPQRSIQRRKQIAPRIRLPELPSAELGLILTAHRHQRLHHQ